MRVNNSLVWNAGNDGSGSGLDADLLDGQQGSYYATASGLTSTTNTANAALPKAGGIMSGPIGRNTAIGTFFEGSYNNVGDNSYNSSPIYTIGSAYNPASTTLGNMYGVGYSHTNASFINFTGGSGWGFYVAADGDARVWLDGSTGVVSSTGQHYVGSSVVWNAGNDGSGSGLDADLLDGQQGSYYAPASHNHSGVYLPISGKAADSELLDGIDSSRVIYGTDISKVTRYDGDWNSMFAAVNTGFFDNASGTNGNPDGFTHHHGFQVRHNNLTNQWGFQFMGSYHTSYPSLYHRNVSAGTWGAWKKLWDSNNDGSGSGLDADLLDGLQLHTGRNNEANKVVRTDGNGYIQAGWINTPSGNHASTITRITASNDDYLRYVTPAQFRVQVIDGYYPTTTGGNASGTWPISVSGSATSVTFAAAGNIVYGANGYGTTNLGFASMTNQKSGFYDVSSSGTPTSTWYSLVNMAHYGANHGHQIAGSFYSAGDLYNRNNNNTSLSAWAKIWNTANDGSGSGLDADLLDGANSDTAATANTIVKRDGNGYINGVYFNSAIGISEALSHDWTKVYASTDNYIRSYSKSDFKVRMGLTKSDYDRMDYTTITQYHTGANSHNDTTFDGLLQRGCGFIDNWNGGAGKPPTGSHYNGFQAMHYGNGSSYFHGMQMAMSAGNPGFTYLRGWWANGGSGYGWQKIWTDGNDGSGSGLDADTVDGLQAASLLRSDASDTVAAGVTYSWTATDTAGLVFTNTSYAKSLHIGGWSGSNTAGVSRIRNSNDNLHMDAGSAGHMYLNHYCTGNVYIRGQTAWHAGNDGSGSGLDADLLDGQQGSYYAAASGLTSTTTTANAALPKAGGTTSGTITLGTQNALVANNYGRGLFGLYSATRYQHVWSMGTAYKTSDDGTSYGNMYGLTYTHTNIGTATNQSISNLSHQLQGRANGTLWWALGSGIWTSGNVTAYSDIAVKTNLVRIPNALEKVCSINGYTYERTDYVKDLEDPEAPDVLRQAGVVAQEIEKVLPEVVSGKEGNKAVAYGNIVALLIESIKELKDEVDDLKQQLKEK